MALGVCLANPKLGVVAEVWCLASGRANALGVLFFLLSLGEFPGALIAVAAPWIAGGGCGGNNAPLRGAMPERERPHSRSRFEPARPGVRLEMAHLGLEQNFEQFVEFVPGGVLDRELAFAFFVADLDLGAEFAAET